MRMLPILMFALGLPGPAGAAAGQDAAAALAAATSLRCVFQNAIETDWEFGAYQTRPQKGFSFTIEAIDTARGNAKAVSREGAAHLEMIALSRVRHFLGFTAGGDLNVTSVHGQFARDEGALLASHSVHMATEPPKTFQHFGACRPILEK
ncbi:MAG: hypothetical protein O2967_07475 [Proteobacteria bacterium]|nr:hypothetical protein [Pseudomonadota bacterium]